MPEPLVIYECPESGSLDVLDVLAVVGDVGADATVVAVADVPEGHHG